MNTSIFDFDFSELTNTVNDLLSQVSSKYNDFVKNNVKKYDLNTKEGYEAFIKEAADIRTELVKNDSVINHTLVNLLDNIVEKAMTNYNSKVVKEENKAAAVKELVDAEVERVKEENHGKLNINKNEEEKERNQEKEEEIDWPSDKLTAKQRRNVQRLVDEYVDTKIVPYLDEDFDEDTVDEMASGLFEFAAWILTKEE